MSVQLILKNSSVQDKAATAQQLEIGEIALNYHESGPFLQCKDTAGQVWRVGGVIVAEEAPGQPQPGTWWFETDTKGLYFYDGTGWTEITGGGGGGGGGGGDITAVVAGEGIKGGGNAGTVTLDADLDFTKGLEFISAGVPGSKIAIKPGANISFDRDGSLRANIGGVSIKGGVDITGPTIPSPVAANDGYYNTVSGTLSPEWQAATGLGAISVEPSDLVVFNGTNWTYVPSAPTAVASVFGRVGAIIAVDGDYQLSQLGDVDLTTTPPVVDNVLQYDGTDWVPVGYNLGELTDVDLTTTPPATDDVLQYDGTDWVPEPLSQATESQAGIVELATAAETTAGTDNTRAVHPAGLKVELDKKLNLAGGNMTGGVTATERTITAGAFDLATGNFWTCGAISIPNPTNAVAGMSGLIILSAAPTGWGSNFKHPGGVAPTPTAFPAVAPFYVRGATDIFVGKPVEGMA